MLSPVRSDTRRAPTRRERGSRPRRAPRLVFLCQVLAACLLGSDLPADGLAASGVSLALPAVGAHELRILSPFNLELTLVTTKAPGPARPRQWDFVDDKGNPRLPAASAFSVLVDGKTNAVLSVGFRRRVLYAPLKRRDLRISNSLYLTLASSIGENSAVEVRNPGRQLWPENLRFAAVADPLRWTPVLHVNQAGYLPAQAKRAIAGYYLGSGGELDLQRALASRERTRSNSPLAQLPFAVVARPSGETVYQGQLALRPDRGFPFGSYEKVWEADFTRLDRPGEYQLVVPGLGASFPFLIDDGVAGILARAYALGLYHQRCGCPNELPFTRFTHGPCHVAPAEVPTRSAKFETVNEVLKLESANAKENPRHTAPLLEHVDASLYPFVNRGRVEAHGGHHDAGDYSKYTINSASLVHCLVFAADNLPGVRELDNLGLPESGDGKSDILQEAKWEADFLARMQDADGGFYFLVYPRDRRYEDNVTPDHGDPQVVFPKTTAATAAATAALAQCASSPVFRRQFPEASAAYLEKAKRGWSFLQAAIARHGKRGAYQRITHYGDYLMHDDELAWAACEMFLATGDPVCADKLAEWWNPSDPGTRRWGWWRLFDAGGNAVRSYAFAARSGRVQPAALSPAYLERCEAEIAAAGADELRRARDSAYGTSFPVETKRTRTAGWYFSIDAAFNLAVACQLEYPRQNDPRSRMLDAVLSNLNYDAGCNPVNVSYLTGVGWRQPHEIVHQYAQNDRRILPPSGIPIGSIQGGFGWLDLYGKELGALSFPADDDPAAPYPFYDRWGDSFNLTTEFVVMNQAHGLAAAAWLMAQTGLKTQPWKPLAGEILPAPAGPAGVAGAAAWELAAPGIDLSAARIVWEGAGQEPAIAPRWTFVPRKPGLDWIEAEALLPDGRRVFAVTNSAR